MSARIIGMFNDVIIYTFITYAEVNFIQVNVIINVILLQITNILIGKSLHLVAPK